MPENGQKTSQNDGCSGLKKTIFSYVLFVLTIPFASKSHQFSLLFFRVFLKYVRKNSRSYVKMIVLLK